MHGEQVGIAVTPSVAIAYAIVAAGLFALGSTKLVTAPAASAAPAE
jgi:AGZA family xanthine/uracil permease-like MFS transporter